MSSTMRQLAAAAIVAVATASTAAGAASNMYKCIEGGRTVYQQQACAVHPDPEPAASAARAMTKASAVAEPAVAGERKVKRPSLPSSAPATPR
jgi:hypothetical protein